MHNQNRVEYKARLSDPILSAKLAEKAGQWNALTRELLVRRGRVDPKTGGRRRASAPSDVDETDKQPSEPAVPDVGSTLRLIEKLLQVNPDPLHLWNFRRELLLLPGSATDKTNASDDVAASNDTNFSIPDELNLTATCLNRNPKAYGAWFHRKWSVRHWLVSSSSVTSNDERNALLSIELGLCASFLEKDERNFHCWNYRRFIVAIMLDLPSLSGDDGFGSNANSGDDHSVRLDGSWRQFTAGTRDAKSMSRRVDSVTMGPQIATSTAQSSSPPSNQAASFTSQAPADDLLQSEWDFTSQKIEKNFSNCSAFHYRSKLLSLVFDAKLRNDEIDGTDADEERLELARGELELVQNAVFTEPDDQTAWWYHRFVVAWAKPSQCPTDNDDDVAASVDSFAQILDEEKDSIRELIEAEGGRCKWGLLALHMILTELGALGILSGEEKSEVIEEANSCLDRLAELDPDRATRYESMRR